MVDEDLEHTQGIGMLFAETKSKNTKCIYSKEKKGGSGK